MKSKMIVFVILFLVTSLSIIGNNTVEKKKGCIILEVIGLKSNKGVVRSHLYNKSEHFPTESRKAMMKKSSSKLSENKVIIKYENVPFGEYAMTTHHDENNNGKMDKTWIGLPDEGWGVSNDAEATLVLPDYEDAKFTLNCEELKIRITMRY